MKISIHSTVHAQQHKMFLRACSGVWGRHTANWHPQRKQHFSSIEVAIMQSLQSLPLVIYYIHVYIRIYSIIVLC